MGVIVDKDYTERYNNSIYLSLRYQNAVHLLNNLKDLNIFNKNKKVLDIGCGSGDFGEVIKLEYKSSVYGIDINKEAVKKSREKGMIVKTSNIENKWPYTDSFFDVLISRQVIEHLVNPDYSLIESKRVLKKGGILVINTPNLAAWYNRILLLLGFQPFNTEVSTIDKTLGLGFTRKMTPIRKPLGHLRVFTLKALKELLELHNFQIISIKGLDVNYFPKYMSFVDKMFSNFPSLASDLLVVAKKK